jgi:hypothetical protein
MNTNQTNTIRTGMKVGAMIGGVVFLIFGIVPAFHYGGMGTVILLSKLAGGPLEFTLALRMIVVFGVLLGMFCLGSVSIVLGAITGTASGYLVSALSPAVPHRAEAEQVAAKN